LRIDPTYSADDTLAAEIRFPDHLRFFIHRLHKDDDWGWQRVPVEVRTITE